MHSSLLLALASALLTHTLPTSPNTNTNSNELQPRDGGWTPVLSYPPGKDAAACPANPGPNPWANNLVPRKRSLTTSPSSLLPTSSNLRRQTPPLCQQIASGSISNFEPNVGNTAELHLLAGATYVFSWAFNQFTARITAWRNNHDGTYTPLQQVRWNEGPGTMTLQIGAAADVHFEVIEGDNDPLSGEFALFLTANGNVNPDPRPGPGGGRHD